MITYVMTVIMHGFNVEVVHAHILAIPQRHPRPLLQTLKASRSGPEASVKQKKLDGPCRRQGGGPCSMTAHHLCPLGGYKTHHSSLLL